MMKRKSASAKLNTAMARLSRLDREWGEITEEIHKHLSIRADFKNSAKIRSASYGKLMRLREQRCKIKRNRSSASSLVKKLRWESQKELETI